MPLQKQISMINNPFILSGSIPEPYFCDRRSESSSLISNMLNGRNTLLISPRRMGKSKLVEYCYAKEPLVSDYYCFYIDIYHTSCLKEFAYTFGRQVFNTLKNKSTKMLYLFIQGLRSLSAKFEVEPLSGMPSFSLSLGDFRNPDFTLEEIFDWIEKADKPCVICFDEFQKIADYPEKNMEALLRSYIQRLSNAQFVFSGSSRTMLSRMFYSAARPFYNSTTTLMLNPIDKEVYTDFVTYWFRQYGKEVSAGTVARVYALMESNTFYMQKMFNRLFSDTSEGRQCEDDRIESTIRNFIEEESQTYHQLLSMLPEKHKELLFAIAKEGKATKIMSGAFINRHRLASSSAVQTAMKKLLELDLISVNDKVYTVPDVLFRMYLLEIAG